MHDATSNPDALDRELRALLDYECAVDDMLALARAAKEGER